MTDDQYIEIGRSVVAMSHRATLNCEDGDYFIDRVSRIYVTQDTALAFLREMGWTVEKRDGTIMMSRDV